MYLCLYFQQKNASSPRRCWPPSSANHEPSVCVRLSRSELYPWNVDVKAEGDLCDFSRTRSPRTDGGGTDLSSHSDNKAISRDHPQIRRRSAKKKSCVGQRLPSERTGRKRATDATFPAQAWQPDQLMTCAMWAAHGRVCIGAAACPGRTFFLPARPFFLSSFLGLGRRSASIMVHVHCVL